MKEYILETEVLKWVLGIAQILIIALCTIQWGEVKKAKADAIDAQRDLASHKLHTAETYMTKSDATRAFDTLSRTLESLGATMNNRFDRMENRLDSKMDKGD
jgi:hypothetical protein